MAWAVRASSPASNGVGFNGTLTGATHTLAMGAAVTAGDLLVLGVWAFNTGTAGAGATQVPTYAVSDSINGSTGWAEVLTQTDLFGGTYGGRHSIWARPNSGAGTPTMTVTYTVAGASNQLSGGLVCAAFSGIATASPYDTGASATAVSTAPDSGAASPATGAASELAVGFYGDYGDNTTLSAGLINGVASTLAVKHDVDSNNWQGLLEYADSGSSGATPHALVSTSGSSHWGLLEAIFKLPGGGSVTGTAGLTLQQPTVAVAGTSSSGVTGTGSLVPQRPSLVVSGTVGTVVTGNAALILPPLTVVLFGATDVVCNVALVLQRPVAAGSGTGSNLPQHYYATTFPLTENPMAEGGVWTQGAVDGIDWQNVRTTPARAFGTQSGSSSIIYDDSIATLKGTFSSDQMARATVFSTVVSGDYDTEVEILLRHTLSGHSLTGYEVNWSAQPGNGYCSIVRFDGSPIGHDFTVLQTVFPGAVVNGDVVTATIVGSTITAYKNGSQVLQLTDSTYTSGHPGLGFFLANRTGTATDNSFGFSQYTAETMPAATAVVTLQRLSVASSGTLSLTTGPVALVLQGLSVAAAGTSSTTIGGTAALVLQGLSSAAAGTVSVPTSGTASLVLPGLTIAGVAYTTVTGSGSLILSGIVVAATATTSVVPPPPVGVAVAGSGGGPSFIVRSDDVPPPDGIAVGGP